MSNMTSWVTKKPLPMFLAVLQDTHDMKRYLCNFSKRVKPYKRKQNPPQCRNCQEFRHTAGRSKNLFRCRTCAREHTTDTSTARTSKANLKGCPAFKQLSKAKPQSTHHSPAQKGERQRLMSPCGTAAAAPRVVAGFAPQSRKSCKTRATKAIVKATDQVEQTEMSSTKQQESKALFNRSNTKRTRKRNNGT